MSFSDSKQCSTNGFATKRHLLQTTQKVSQLLLGSAIALTLSSLPLAATAQSKPSITTNLRTTGQLLAEADSVTVEEKIARLDAAVLTVENQSGEYATREKINMLLWMAEGYSTLGEQSQAVALLDRALQIVESTASDDRPYSPIWIVPTYIRIGETETAEALIAKAVETNDYIRTKQLINIAEAYIAVDNADLAASKLSQAIERLGEPSDSEEVKGLVFSIGIIAQAYGQLTDSVATQAGLARLVALTDASVEVYNASPEAEIRGIDSTFITTLSQLAIAQSQHGNTEEAETLARRAMERVRSVKVPGYIMAGLAEAYGYIEDKAVTEQALSELKQLAIANIESVDPLGPLSALGAIAISYEQLGNTSQAQQALVPLQEAFGNDLYMLGGLLSIRLQMEDVAAQEAIIQQMFAILPALRNAEFAVSDVTAGYAGITGLVEAYMYTADDQIAQQRLAMLEDFFKTVEFDPSGLSGQLSILARAAAQRGDYEAAERLLAEGTQALAMDRSTLTRRWGARAVYRLSSGYLLLEDEQVKQTGLDRLQQIAEDNSDAALSNTIRDAFIRARARF